MAASVNSISDNLIDLVRKNNKEAITFSWPDFYQVCERERIKQPFLDSLAKCLMEKSYLIAYGNSAVLVTRDFNWQPVLF